ncbi:MAG: hypothetical protein QOD42_2960 [Sphingomonadales bacterium]|jgi:hypothetical protein|nr:hypothetical protein [Sphingomonadales bacterium]
MKGYAFTLILLCLSASIGACQNDDAHRPGDQASKTSRPLTAAANRDPGEIADRIGNRCRRGSPYMRCMGEAHEEYEACMRNHAGHPDAAPYCRRLEAVAQSSCDVAEC